ncbi:uncharacterized protein [Primulina eburnea]|uniref:uncharacterized protein n=1 Tax=Primulina eburnea TaxID=1245227 RepID=UPI003C6C80C3
MTDNRENDRQMPLEAIPIRYHFRPVINAHYSGISRGTINANNFELKPALINMLKIEISSFRKTDFEQLYEAWERYKELLRRFPNHGFEDWVQIELFYNGLNGQTRTTVDATAGGTIFAKSPAQAYDLLEQMTINSYQWASERSGVKRTAGVYAVDPITSLTAQVSALTTQIATMNKVEGEFTEGTRRNHPQKLLDPGEFIVRCEIGGKLVENAICDSGASVNIMSSSLYGKLGWSMIKPTGLSLQMSDKSVRTPLGIVEDFELRIDKLKALAWFMVLDIENSHNVHVILGRPLLAAVGAFIDVKRGKLTMEVEGQMVEIKASESSHDRS